MMVRVTRQGYIEDLELLQQKVTEMGQAVDVALGLAMQALLGMDKELAEKVMKEDDIIDEMTIGIEDRCMLLIAKQQPIARDLRVIATGFKISTDLERIGDHAYDIAKTVLELEGVPFVKKLIDIPKMAESARRMTELAIRAYQTADLKLAEEVCQMDDEIDLLFARTFHELSQFVGDDAVKVKQATQLIFVARYIERIGDHATNIAEWVIYLETAERIRKPEK